MCLRLNKKFLIFFIVSIEKYVYVVVMFCGDDVGRVNDI